MLNDMTYDELAIATEVRPPYYVSRDEMERIADKLASHGRRWSVWRFYSSLAVCRNTCSDERRRRDPALVEFTSARFSDGRYAVLVRATPRQPDFALDVGALVADGGLRDFIDSLRISARSGQRYIDLDSKYVVQNR